MASISQNYRIPNVTLGANISTTASTSASRSTESPCNIFKAARSHLQRGAKNAILGQYKMAYGDYDMGLKALSRAIEAETNESKKESMKNILLRYLEKAVEVKKRLDIDEVTASTDTINNTSDFDLGAVKAETERIKIVQTENFEYEVFFPNEDKANLNGQGPQQLCDEVKLSTPSISEIIASMEETKVETCNPEKTNKEHVHEVKELKRKTRKKRIGKSNKGKTNIDKTVKKPQWDSQYETTPIHLLESPLKINQNKSCNNASPRVRRTPRKKSRAQSNKIPRTTKYNTSSEKRNRSAYGRVSSKVNSNLKSNQAKRKDDVADENSKFESIVNSEIMHGSAGVTWEDVAGLTLAKHTLQEAVILPMLRPDIFNGIRAPSKGVLLYGPPGTGKTMLAKAVATESNATFFSISASSLTSKWVGESSKLVRALFDLANKKAPSVVFIDEIDSMLTKRKSSEHNGGRQLKTEFLVQFDGARTSERKGHVLIIGATNRPWDLDEAVLRRLAKRVCIPLPDEIARRNIIENLMCKQNCEVSEDELKWLVQATEKYSGSDLKALCHEAALGPLRGLGHEIANIHADEVRPIDIADFEEAISVVRPSFSSTQRYREWTQKFGASC